jgi:hypothetical protein
VAVSSLCKLLGDFNRPGPAATIQSRMNQRVLHVIGGVF